MASPEYEEDSDYPLTSIDSIDQSTPFLHDFGDTSPVTDPPSRQGSPSPAVAAEEPRGLTFINGLAILLGVQIGSGIFSVPSQVSQHVPSPAIGVAAWVVGGLLVMTGAASLIELGLAITEHGGMQEYLRCCYNDFAAFLFTSVWVGIAKPCSMAVIATVFAEHACEILLSKAACGVVLTKAIAILGVLSIAAINCAGARSGVKVANLFLVLKIGALVSIVLLGFVRASMGLGKGVWSEDDNHGWFDSPDHEKVAPWIMIGNLVTALFGALFCYSGWESIGFVAAELANPTRDLPRILTVGVAIVTIAFTLTNVSLYLILPFDTIRSHSTVVIQFAKQVLGTYGAVIYSFIVALSCLGALNANIIATSALCVAASDRGYFSKVFSNRSYVPLESDFVLQHAPTWSFQGLALSLRRKLDESRMKTNAPVYSVLLNSSLACIYIAAGTFNGLIIFIGISEYLFFFFGIAGVFVIRARHNSFETPPPAIRTWSGNPIIFCTVSAFVVIQGIIKDFFQGVFILVTVFLGWIWFRIMIHR